MKDRWELMKELNCIEIDDDGNVVENADEDTTSFVQSDPNATVIEVEEENPETEKVNSVIQVSTLCATIIALICEIMNLIEVIVNYVVSYSMFSLTFAIIGVFSTLYYTTKINDNIKLLICGIICLVLAGAFAILWLLSTFGVIK